VVPQTSLEQKKSPVFLSLAIVSLLLLFITPRLLIFFPLMGVLAFSVISLFRKERGRGGAIVVSIVGVGLVWLSSIDLPSIGSSTTSSLTMPDTSRPVVDAQIADWNWHAEPSFGTHGTIKWNVEVRNNSTKDIESAKVEFTTYDKAGKLVSSTYTYVDAIPAGGRRSEQSYADYYGTERNAAVQVIEVR